MKDAPWIGFCREEWEERTQLYREEEPPYEEDEDEPLQSDE